MPSRLPEPVRRISSIRFLAVHDGVPVIAVRSLNAVGRRMRGIPTTEVKIQTTQYSTILGAFRLLHRRHRPQLEPRAVFTSGIGRLPPPSACKKARDIRLRNLQARKFHLL